jgi:transcriptional regulator with XRE-family HTH domain
MRDGHPPLALRAVPRPEPLLRHLLGATLRDVRTGQGRTLREVSERARVSMPYLSEVERGRKEASSEVLAAVARALGLRLTDLLAMAWQELELASPDGAPSAPAAPIREAQPTAQPEPHSRRDPRSDARPDAQPQPQTSRGAVSLLAA